MPRELKQGIFEKLKLWNRPSLRNKTLWHWLDLLIVPIVLATGAAVIQWQSGMRQEKVTTDRNRQETLAKYLEQMTALLIKEHLRNSQSDSEVRVVARARTLTALRELDGERKGQLILFLAEAGLISKQCQSVLISGVQKQNCQPGIVSLKGASLRRADIAGARVGRTRFKTVSLKGADLQGADLEEAKLGRVNLEGANLRGVKVAKLQRSATQRLKASSSKNFRKNFYFSIQPEVLEATWC
jgi:hypothetical protein